MKTHFVLFIHECSCNILLFLICSADSILKIDVLTFVTVTPPYMLLSDPCFHIQDQSMFVLLFSDFGKIALLFLIPLIFFDAHFHGHAAIILCNSKWKQLKAWYTFNSCRSFVTLAAMKQKISHPNMYIIYQGRHLLNQK